MTLEDTRNISQILQGIAVCVAAVAGGVWTFYTFNRLGVIRKAETELQALKKSLDGEINLSLSLGIAPAKCAHFSKESIGFFVTATITNKGTIPANIDLTVPPFIAMKLEAGEEHPEPEYVQRANYYSISPDPDILLVTYVTCYPGVDTVLCGYLEVPEAGLHLVAFTTYKGSLEDLDAQRIKGISRIEAERKTDHTKIMWNRRALLHQSMMVEIEKPNKALEPPPTSGVPHL